MVVEQHHRLACGFLGKAVELLAADHFLAVLGPREHFGRVEHTELEAALESPAKVHVKVSLADKALLETLYEAHHHLSALEVGA